METQFGDLYRKIRNGSLSNEQANREIDQILQKPGRNKRDTIISRVLAFACEILNINKDCIDIEVPLKDLGLYQVERTQLLNKINKAYGLNLSTGILYEYDSLYCLADYLETICESEAFEASEVNTDSLYKQTVEYLKKLLSPIIKVPVERMKEEDSFEKYGINSILTMQLTDELENSFGKLPKTLFFEYQSLKDLTTYFIESFHETLVYKIGFAEASTEKRESDQAQRKSDQVKEETVQVKRIMNQAKRDILPMRMEREEDVNGNTDIAIIGAAGHYPDSNNLEEFWINLKNGIDSIREIPKERWDYNKYYDKEKGKYGKTNTKWGGFLDSVDEFDPLFFNISPTEAEKMDPQERLFLECVYEALEDAAYTRGTIRRNELAKVGVYVGVMYEEYPLYGAQEQIQDNPIALGGNSSSIANRISYFFNLNGPSISLNTMCSSSLTALHLACQSINQGECETAIAGGVNLSIHPNKYISLGQGNFASSKGRCESFGEGGDGYVPGEGVGALILKSLSQAIKDKDNIYGVIKGTAINHGGKTNGYTVPNPNMQAEVIERALLKAKVHPRTISYLEAHGTGTVLGDPIEIAGLEKVYKKYTKDLKYCAIGSVKSNIGHCEGAAGIAAVTKVLLQMKYKQLVPSLHAKALNPNIDFDHSPFMVQQSLQAWERPDVTIGVEVEKYPRRAGISAFGAGGSNAHIILEEYEYKEQTINNQNDPLEYPIILSAATKEKLFAKCQKLLEAIEKEEYSKQYLVNLAYTLQVGREDMKVRLAFLTTSMDKLKEQLRKIIDNNMAVAAIYYGDLRNKENKQEQEENLEQKLREWIEVRDYDKLLKSWIEGIRIGWSSLYKEKLPRRISLPTYPFDKKKYWYKDREQTEQEVGKEQEKADHLMYLPVWEERQDCLEAVTADRCNQNILIVYSQSAVRTKEYIEEYLGKKNNYIMQIQWADKSEKLGDNHFVSFVQDADGLADCIGQMDRFDCVFFLSDAKTEKINFSYEVDNEIMLVRLSKVIKQKAKEEAPIDFFIVTYNNYGFSLEDTHPYGGGITGLAYSIAQSSENMLIRNIDLSCGDIARCENMEELVKSILRVPASLSGEVTRIRKNKTYRQVFQKINSHGTENFRKDGTYIILGGSGTVGKIITWNLIQKYQCNVAWIGRRPEASEEVGKALEQCSFFGKMPYYVQADVTNHGDIVKAVKSIKKQFHHINGAIFSGVVFDFHNSISQTTEEQFHKIFEVKAQGSINFFKALEKESLDFLCYFSSGQAYSFSGAGNLSAYAAGITFTDTYVRYLQGNADFPVGCINWGFWKSSVSGGFGKSLSNCINDLAGFVCFERYIYLLRKYSLSQVLALDLCKVLTKEVSVKADLVSFAEYSGKSVLKSVLEDTKCVDYPDNYEEKVHIPNDLESIILKILFLQVKDLLNSKILDKYGLWMKECKEILGTHGFIENAIGTTVLRKEYVDLNLKEQWSIWEEVKSRYGQKPDYKAQVRLIEACLKHIPDILTGVTLATNVLFPNATMDLVEDIYSNNSVEDFYNQFVADMVVTCVKMRLESGTPQPIRIIEAGAGTGGTSRYVIDKLKPYASNIKYCYTDISNSFLKFAENKFGHEGLLLAYKLWNVDEPLYTQEGIEQGTYDIVIATNVLHATKNMMRTLNNVKAVLKANGLLIVNEITKKNLITTITFGLLDGWWRFEDEALRIEGSPLLSTDSWKFLLTECGFHNFSLPTAHLIEMGQQIIAAESDGIIRQDFGQNNQPLEISNKEQEKLETLAQNISVNNPYRMDTKIKESKITGIKLTDRKEYVQNVIREILGKVLKVAPEEFISEIAFSEYGLDSILGGTFISQLNARLDIELNNAVLFDYATIHLLSEYIAARFEKKLNEQITKDIVKIQNKLEPLSPVEKELEIGVEYTPVSKKLIRKKESNIAVIGISGQFPDALNVEELWDNIINRVDCVHELPPEYLDQSRYYSKQKVQGKSNCKWGGILSERDCFEPLFFNISPREAETMNPHQRLILEEGWKAIEDAGYNPKTLTGTQTGVYIGAEPTNYAYGSFIGSSDAIVSSRLSYYLNLLGPAITLNTGCSSSAAAIHLACESLRNGEIDLAIAGGVYANLNQQSLITLSGIDMISSTGRCYTFDDRADGTVMSEGVGIVILKRLEDAIKDKDAVYGVISASGMNQDGASNGITAPSGLAQEKLIHSVYEKFQIQVEDITYIETHGTGTKLGDPVEFNALNRVFSQSTTKEGYCSLGSIKTNIGHTGAASGVISLIKVLLCLKYKKLPALCHFQKINSNIELKGSPFIINQELYDWENKGHKPLKAAINSFGHSGTNVHLVVEEYQHSEIVKQSGKDSLFLIPFSAKNVNSLKEYVEKIIQWLERSQRKEFDIRSFAYTLQTGREEMDARVLFLVKDGGDLLDKLKQYVYGTKEISNCWRGVIKKGENLFNVFTDDDDIHAALEKWIAKGNYKKIGRVWTQGMNINWSSFYRDKTGRMNLPTYPFKREKFTLGLKMGMGAPMSNAPLVNYAVNGLVQKNLSGLSGVLFGSGFTGEEEFLKDHIVGNRKIMPAAAYLEMACGAIRAAANLSEIPDVGICLKQIIWVNPFYIEEENKINISLEKKENGAIQYRIYKEAQEDKITYSQGVASFITLKEDSYLELDRIKDRCMDFQMLHEECYEILRSAGFNYGPAFQGIQAIYASKNEVLASLQLPINNGQDNYILHPGMLDSALQAIIGLKITSKSEQVIEIPYALEQAVIFHPMCEKMWSYIRYSEDEKKLDIDICDEQGRICLIMRSYSLRSIPRGERVNKEDIKSDLLLLKPYVNEVEVGEEGNLFKADKHYIIMTEFMKCRMNALKEKVKHVNFIYLKSDKTSNEDKFEAYAIQLIEEIKKIFQENLNRELFLQLILSEEQYCPALGGILKTARLENPKLHWEMLELESSSRTLDFIRNVNPVLLNYHVRYADSKVYINTWEEMNVTHDAAAPWKDGKVYLITGGAGGLGLLFAEDIKKNAINATVILLGSSPLNELKRKCINKLCDEGVNIIYYEADITKREAVQQVIQDVVEIYGNIDGVIHSAGVTADNYIVNSDSAENKKVLDVKVKGLINLHECTKTIPMEFMICCSSYAGVFGNVGQANYSAANAFMDSFVKLRNRFVQKRQCYGKTISLNWSFWEKGGMKVSKEIVNSMYRQTGMSTLSTSNGLKALYLCLANEEEQVVVLEGNKEKMKKELFIKKEVIPIITNRNHSSESAAKESDLSEELKRVLKQEISDVMHVHSEDIDELTEFGEYGFDSITYTELSNNLNKKYDLNLIPTVFFVCSNLTELLKYFIKEYSETLSHRLLGKSDAVRPEIPAERTKLLNIGSITDSKMERIHTVSKEPNEETEKEKNKESKKVNSEAEKDSDYETDKNSIAIIGMSGRFPGAQDLDKFWNNILEGKETITEIPKERWDWKQYFGDPKKEGNKTNIKWGGFIDGIEEFDPLFFGISPRQAEIMDPQQRLILQYVYKAIEDAGYAPKSLAGSQIGVFIGTGMSGYSSLLLKADNAKDGYFAVGNAAAMGPNRASFFFDFHGPSEPIDTACSSSLVAIHRAIGAIQNGCCESAIVGGVNTILTPDLHISFNKSNMLSTDGHCKTFSDNANGYVRGEGIGMIFIKKLKDAVKAKDHIYGIIRGSSENHGGRANSITAPNPAAQTQVIKAAYKRAGIHPSTVTYQEAHGTGTELGDPIEFHSLCDAFSANYEQFKAVNHDLKCGLGSVKTNIGHLEFAAGIVSVIKVLLQFKYKTLVKSLNCDVINPYIRLENTPFYIVQEPAEWKQIETVKDEIIPRRAGISSFGFGGVNAYIILEEFIKKEVKKNEKLLLPVCIPFSAKDTDRLKELCKAFIKEIEKGYYEDDMLFDIAYTMQVGRDVMESRLAVIVNSVEELKQKLYVFITTKEPQRILSVGSEDENCITLAQRWVSGNQIQWEELYKEERPKRINLPTYVFAKEHFWVEEQPKEWHTESEKIESDQQGEESVILEKHWERSELKTIASLQKGGVIVLGTSKTSNLAQKIFKSAEIHTILIIHKPNEQMHKGIESDFYSADKAMESFNILQEYLQNQRLLGIVDLTAYDDEYEDKHDFEEGKIVLLQKLLENYNGQLIKIVQVTNRLQAFGIGESTLKGSRSLGLYKMLQAEYKMIQSISMDCDSFLEDFDTLKNQIQNEFFSEMDKKVTECCYRNKERFIPNLKISEKLTDNSVNVTNYNEDDVIIITGGMGGIGSAICNEIIEHGAKKIVIMGREPLPPKEVWQEYRKEYTNPELVKKLKKLIALVNREIQVSYYNISLTDKESLEKMLHGIHQEMGLITGVFHCAGITGRNPMFHKKSIQEMEQVWEPKVNGLITLHEVLKHEPLNYFVLFSSVSGVVPKLASGISDYAMANTFMDCYCLYQRGKNRSYFKSIQWTAWSQTGMSKGGMITPAYINMGMKSNNTEEGLAFFNHIIDRPYAVVLPCIVDPKIFLVQDLLLVDNGKADVIKMNLNKADNKGNDNLALKTLTRDWISDIFSKELKLKAEHINVDKPFEEYGVDSIVIAQLIQTIQDSLQTKIPVSLLVEYRTISAITDYFMGNHKPGLERLFLNKKPVQMKQMKQQEEKSKVESKEESKEEQNNALYDNGDMAIVGISCRFPGSANHEAFWDTLVNGRLAIKEKPANRWKNGADRSDYGGWIEDINIFDEGFFHINKKDAAIMDPQARIILEESLKAIYDAGYDHKELWGKEIGVYIGARSQHNRQVDKILTANNPILGVGQNYIASNVSRFFNLQGPSMLVDTACSSGISGLILASDALRQERIDMALVGAVNILEESFAHDIFSARNILSKDGTFKIFDKDAHGEVLGEGCGVVIIKRLSDAVRDGNHIYAVVKGIAVNNDGRTLGPGSPNIDAQKRVMKKALEISKKQPEDVGYIEVNGGGTPIMDAIEIKALSEVYVLQEQGMKACALGSVKPNIGHLLLAAGMAGFIRCVLSVYHKKIPPLMSANNPMEEYDFTSSRVVFHRKAVDWIMEAGERRCAALDLFPDGGTNYHVIVEEFIPTVGYLKKRSPKKAPHLERHDYSMGQKEEISSSAEQPANVSIKNIWGEIRW